MEQIDMYTSHPPSEERTYNIDFHTKVLELALKDKSKDLA